VKGKDINKGKTILKGDTMNRTALAEPTDRMFAHELNRIRTMGDRVVQRLKTIGKARKLWTFALALEAEGRWDDAKEAYRLLREMGFTPKGNPTRN